MATDEEDSEEGGLLPSLGGMAAYEGLPLVAAPLLTDVPHGLAKFVMSGQPIGAAAGTPISRLAEFTRSEVNAIRSFATEQGVTIPIVASGPGLESGYMFDRPNPLQRLMQRLTGKVGPDAVPHVGLSTGSVPHALHEIGHAAPIAGSHALRRAFQGLAQTMGLRSTIGDLVRTGLVAGALVPPGEDASDIQRFVHENAPALVGATLLPEVAEEARASINALQGSRKFGPGITKTLIELAPAFGTYLAAAAAPVLATILAKRVANALRGEGRPEQPAEKMAAAAPGTEVKAPGALRASASSAWHVGSNPPKPKTIAPAAQIGTAGRGRATAKPPSKTSFYKDMLESLYNPQRGARLATPG